MNTKMTLHQNNQLASHQRRVWTRGLVIGFLSVAIGVFVLLYAPLRSVVTNAVYSIAPFVWETGNKTESALGTFLANLKDKDTIVEENEKLNNDISVMEVKVLDRNLLAEKVTMLEEALGRSRNDDRVVASVLVGVGRSPYDTIVIDAGEKEGVIVGNVVVYSGSGVIGEVVETTPYTSKIKLHSSPGEEHRVTIGLYHIPSLAIGRGMGNFEAKVPQNSIVSVGDNILTAKNNLILGTVLLIEEKPEEPVKRIFFRAPFNITEIQNVEVILNKQI